MSGYEKMRAFCAKADGCKVEGTECPYECECNLIRGFSFEWTDEDIARLVKLAQEVEENEKKLENAVNANI